MKLFDAHCHLQDDRLWPHLDVAMAQAKKQNVAGLMCCGSGEEDWPLLPDVARCFPEVRLSFGLHPWYVAERSPRWLDILNTTLVTYPSCVGEIGLDHALDRATFADQESAFLAQIHLANELQRPVSIHCRRAWGRLMQLLDEKGWPANGFVLHSYSGSSELIQPLARRGAFFSFSGAITFTANHKGREALTAVPLDRLLIETDAPDLAPDRSAERLLTDSKSGKPINEPSTLPLVLETVAQLRGMDAVTLAAVLWKNAASIFP